MRTTDNQQEGFKESRMTKMFYDDCIFYSFEISVFPAALLLHTSLLSIKQNIYIHVIPRKCLGGFSLCVFFWLAVEEQTM